MSDDVATNQRNRIAFLERELDLTRIERDRLRRDLDREKAKSLKLRLELDGVSRALAELGEE